MKITIIGCGNAGSTVGADLALKGHDVTLVKSSPSKLHNEHFKVVLNEKKLIVEENGSEKTANINVSEDLSVISAAELIIVYVQTNYHEDVIKTICNYISDGQTVIIEPGYLSTCYFMKYTDKRITIIEAESSPIDCRITEPGKVKVLFRNTCNPFGVYPASDKEKAAKVLDSLGFPYTFTQSVIEAALHNPNLIVHTTGAIMSVPRIEYASKQGVKYWMYKEVFTPHVWNMVMALDNEKMNVLEKLGYERLSYVEACKRRNSTDESRDATEVFFDYANNSSPDGPDIPDSRYVTEDVPQGLVLLESLGKVLKIDTPVCSGLINIASSLLCRDFRAEGRSIERLGRGTIERIAKDVE